MEEFSLRLVKTPALNKFKEMAGQNNHFLITILVGLDEVATGNVTLDSEFSTSWNPKDPRRSAHRSRDYAIKAFLAWLKDALDSYVTGIKKIPGSPITENEWIEIQKIDGFAKKLTHISAHLGCEDKSALALTEFLVFWRNRMVHTVSDQHLPNDLIGRLRKNSEEIHPQYRHLDVETMIKRWQAGKGHSVPSFKEATAMSRASQNFISEVDSKIVEKLDNLAYFNGILSEYLKYSDTKGALSTKLWGRGPEKSLTALRNLAITNGMTATTSGEGVPFAEIQHIASMTPREGVAYFSIN